MSHQLEHDILRRKRRDTYLDEYEDEDEVMDNKIDKSSSIRHEAENWQSFGFQKKPSEPNFNNAPSKSEIFQRNSLNKRRMLSNSNANSNINKNINDKNNSLEYIKSSNLQFEQVLESTPGPEVTGENWGLVYPDIKGTNQIPRSVVIHFLTSHQLRENLLHIFGCLLQRPVDFLSEPQYTALYTIYIELRNRPSRIHSALKHLKNVPNSDLNDQIKSIMEILGQILPPYIACAATFWVQEIQHNRINLNKLLPDTCPKNFNILQEISAHSLKLQAVMKPIDAPSRMTEIILGKYFVKILNDVQKLKVVLSQAMFGIILSNFPLIPYDPVLDEYIKFIFKVTIEGKISSWQDIELQQITGDPYRFIKTIIGHILLLPHVPRSIKEALAYIRIHLKPVLNTHANPDFQIMNKLNVRKFNLESLFSFIVPNFYSKETICLKNRFLQYIQDYNLKNSWILSEMERLRYTNPHDLLLAYLAKLQRHIPSQDEELSKMVTALLSVLIIDKQNKQFAPVTKNVEIFAILGYLASPDFGPKVNTIYNKVVTALVSQPKLQTAINKLVPAEKNKCIVIDECLKQILQNVEQLNLELPRRMEKVINELNEILPIQAIDPKCKTVLNFNNPLMNIKENIPFNPNNIEETTFGSANEISTRHNLHSFQTSTHKVLVNPSNSHTHPNNGNNHFVINNAKLVNIFMLPPMVHPNQGVTIYINDKGVPVPDNANIPGYPGNAKVTLPSVIIILMTPDINDPFGSMSLNFKTQILSPLVNIASSTDLTSILGDSVSNLITSGKCPTLGALLVHLLHSSKANPKVHSNRKLLIDINTYLSGLDLLAVITLPVVLSIVRIKPINDVLFSIVDISEPHKSTISVTPPSDVPEGSLVYVIMDPNKLKEPVDEENPYGSLLPNVKPNTPGSNYIKELEIFFNDNKMRELFPNLQPKDYTSKGILLIVILQKLPKVPEIVEKPLLKKVIVGYIWAILIPAFFTEVSYPDIISKFKRQPKMKPVTSILLQLLPSPKNEEESVFFGRMQILLEREDLFDILLIPKPNANTNQKDLLKAIIIGVINSPEKFKSITVEACEFYHTKMYKIKKGELPLVWKRENRKVITLKVPLGVIINNVINYDKLSDKKKNAYNDLLAYLRENPNIFSLMSDFCFKKYKTEGRFIKGLFNYMLETQIIFQSAKSNIKAILPHVMLKGPGAKPLKLNENSKSVNGRRSASQLEINI